MKRPFVDRLELREAEVEEALKALALECSEEERGFPASARSTTLAALAKKGGPPLRDVRGA